MPRVRGWRTNKLVAVRSFADDVEDQVEGVGVCQRQVRRVLASVASRADMEELLEDLHGRRRLDASFPVGLEQGSSGRAKRMVHPDRIGEHRRIEEDHARRDAPRPSHGGIRPGRQGHPSAAPRGSCRSPDADARHALASRRSPARMTSATEIPRVQLHSRPCGIATVEQQLHAPVEGHVHTLAHTSRIRAAVQRLGRGTIDRWARGSSWLGIRIRTASCRI